MTIWIGSSFEQMPDVGCWIPDKDQTLSCSGALLIRHLESVTDRQDSLNDLIYAFGRRLANKILTGASMLNDGQDESSRKGLISFVPAAFVGYATSFSTLLDDPL